ncbi:MAG: LLM class F420-dependent oxidoreductase, partial [Dehalococcoidia bacterium]
MAQVGIMVEGQEDLTWERWHRFVDLTESLGYESLWRSDHLTSLEGEAGREALEIWVSLSTLATRTSRIRFGPMVSPITFRHPSIVAKMAASIDRLSGGRLELGLGAGWHRGEHQAFGIPFPPLAVRFEMLEEGLQVIRALWAEDNVSFDGVHYRLEDVTCYPRPLQTPRPPIIIGGNGERRTLPLVATYADEWNGLSLDPPSYRAKREVLRARCEEIGRDPASVKCSWMGSILIGRDESELRARLERILGVLTSKREVTPTSTRGSLVERGWLAGTPSQVIEQMQRMEEAGAQRFMLQL